MPINVLHKFDTVFSADCLEFNPSNQSILALGTYQILDPSIHESTNPDTDTISKTNRTGKLYLFDTLNDQLNLTHSLNTNAILDLKWSKNHSFLLAQADAKSTLTLYSDASLSNPTIHTLDLDSLLLSLDWYQDSTKIATSTSKGTIALCDIERGFTSEWKAHAFEAWICAMNKNVVYSGGDDGLFLGWDIKSPSHSPTFKIKYDAGVTAIQINPRNENQVLVGSYDESLNAYDTRTMKLLWRKELGSGVWRIKHHPTRDLILLACMGGGFHVVDKNGNKESLFEHQSLAYGCDWSIHGDKSSIGTCSFYDHLFCLSEYS